MLVAFVAGREAFMTRHEPTGSGVTRVVIDVSGDDPLTPRADALVRTCGTEVGGQPDAVRPVGDDRFAFDVRPALDDADERQLKGCLEDTIVDNILARVTEMTSG
jgi:hypothetical protein